MKQLIELFLIKGIKIVEKSDLTIIKVDIWQIRKPATIN